MAKQLSGHLLFEELRMKGKHAMALMHHRSATAIPIRLAQSESE